MTKTYRIGRIETPVKPDEQGKQFAVWCEISHLFASGKKTQERTFDNLAQLLNFVIAETWVKNKEGFDITSDSRNERYLLTKDELDLAETIARAYRALENVKKSTTQPPSYNHMNDNCAYCDGQV